MKAFTMQHINQTDNYVAYLHINQWNKIHGLNGGFIINTTKSLGIVLVCLPKLTSFCKICLWCYNIKLIANKINNRKINIAN